MKIMRVISYFKRGYTHWIGFFLILIIFAFQLYDEFTWVHQYFGKLLFTIITIIIMTPVGVLVGIGDSKHGLLPAEQRIAAENNPFTQDSVQAIILHSEGFIAYFRGEMENAEDKFQAVINLMGPWLPKKGTQSNIQFGKQQHYLIHIGEWKCTNKCSYCWQVLLGREEEAEPFNIREKHSLEEWVKGINGLPPSTLDIMGGEITMLEGFSDFIKQLDKTKHAICISTNLQATDGFLNLLECEPIWFRSITCSWHKEGEIPFEEFLYRLIELKNRGFPIHVNVVKSPIYKLKPFQKDWRDLRKIKQANITVNQSPFEDPREIEYQDTTLICNAGYETFVVTIEGDVYRCLTWFRSPFREKGYLGNIFANTFKPLTTSNNPCNLTCETYFITNKHHRQKNMFSTHIKQDKEELA